MAGFAVWVKDVYRSRLNTQAVFEIRKRAEAGESHYVIANDYGVHRSTVSRISSRRNWRSVTEQETSTTACG